MTLVERLRREARDGVSGQLAGNLVARVLALAALMLVSLVVARTAGPSGVGLLVMLRLLPWLTALLTGLGIWGAAPYFLSGPGRDDPTYSRTFTAMTVCSGAAGAGLWLLAVPVLQPLLLEDASTTVATLAAVTVLSQMLETSGKAFSQGTGDLRGSNRMIVLEEALFLPVYSVAVAAGAPSDVAMLVGLVSGDLLNAAQGWARLLRRGFLAGTGRPSLACARTIARYGIRAQVGSIVLLLNARLDFALVGALAGPGPLGIYAVASRYAELLRLPALALNYVLYPAYARRQAAAESDARAALRRTAWLPAAGAVPLAALAPLVLPAFYGPEFRDAVVPALILLVGMAGGGVTGVVTAYLSASGRPGMTSAALGAGLAVTLLLDVLLIPPYGVVGAAVASTAAYLSTAVVLMVLFRAVTRSGPRPRTSTRTVASIAEVP